MWSHGSAARTQAASAVPTAGVDARGADAFVERVIQTIRTEWDGFTEQVHALHVAGGVVTATGTSSYAGGTRAVRGAVHGDGRCARARPRRAP